MTGAGHGMGEAEARLFAAAEGARVIAADILEHEAERVAAEIRAVGGEATSAKIDVTSESPPASLTRVRSKGSLRATQPTVDHVVFPHE